MEMTGAQILMETLLEQGTDVIVGYPGGTVLDLYEQIYRNEGRIRHVLPSHEQGGFMRRMDMPEQQAKRPCIYCGGGVIMADAGEEIMELSRRLDAPICHSLMGVDAVPTDFPASLGMSGMHGQYASTKAIAEADLLIAVGARFSDRAVGDKQKYAAKAKIIHIEIDLAEVDKSITVDLPLIGDAKEILGKILAAVEGGKKEKWQAEIAEMRAFGRMHATDYSGKLTPDAIIDAVSRVMPKDTPIVTDVGQHQMWVAQRYPFAQPRTFLTSGGLGTMGFGMGAANGACIGTGRKTVLFTGDGSFAMNSV